MHWQAGQTFWLWVSGVAFMQLLNIYNKNNWIGFTLTVVFVLWSISCTRRRWVVVTLTCAAGNCSESSYGSSGIHCLCSKHHRIYSVQWKMEVSHYFRISFINVQPYKYYTPIQRRESSSHELCPTEYWGSVGDSQTPRELCSHRLGRRWKNLPVFSQPGRRYAASYNRRVD